MYICLACGKTFETPISWEERHGFTYGPFEQCSGSPCCSDGYAPTYSCDCCGEWIDDAYIKLESGERICANCYTTYELGDER